MMYTQKVIERFKNPQNAGIIQKASGIGQVGNASCGDIMKIYLKIDENNTITDAKFKTFGCTAAIASTDIACDLIIGKTIEEALKVTNKQVVEQLGSLPPLKIHCSILAEEAIVKAVKDFRKKQEKLKK